MQWYMTTGVLLAEQHTLALGVTGGGAEAEGRLLVLSVPVQSSCRGAAAARQPSRGRRRVIGRRHSELVCEPKAFWQRCTLLSW